jgi:hypothetical protein
MRHPLADSERETLLHLLQNFSMELEEDSEVSIGESPAVPEDLHIAERLMNVFHATMRHEAAHIPPELRPNAGIWEMVKHEFHGPVYRILASGDVAELAEYLRNGLRESLAYGLGPGPQVFAAMKQPGPGRDANLVLIKDRLASLAVALGALKHENPEQGRYGDNLRLDVPELTRVIEHRLNMKISRPRVAGLFGVVTKADDIVDVRVPDDVYSAHRLHELSDILDRHRVCEIGAGFGGTAFQAGRFGLSPYTIVDLPVINVLQGFFLMRIFGGDAVKMFGEDVPERPFNVLPYWSFFDPAVAFDLVFNRDSMPEMPAERAHEYLQEISNRRCAFLSINQESGGAGGPAGAPQLAVHELMRTHPNMRSAGRHPHWTRKGYVEELFIPTSA